MREDIRGEVDYRVDGAFAIVFKLPVHLGSFRHNRVALPVPAGGLGVEGGRCGVRHARVTDDAWKVTRSTIPVKSRYFCLTKHILSNDNWNFALIKPI